MKTSQRKRRVELNQRTDVMLRRRMACSLEDQMWDQMPAVGREFGNPDFDRLMEEDFRLGQGVFNPALVSIITKRQVGILKGKLLVPDTFDAPLPHDVLADFEGGAQLGAPK
ncbi:MAG: hypothetical protein E6Q40_03220 [Cupriavidus sp.]|nr:MAG: hypothetical protein E6Q40_03220 [Cupriavidus sp.]